MRVLMSGGGTAGHIYPALTVAEQLAAGRDEVTFVGTPDGLESRLVPEAGVRFVALPAAGFNRSRPWTLLTSTVRIAVSAVTAWRLIGAEKPDVVAGFGGYVSVPVGLAAIARGVPLVLHEQNSVPGLANRFLARWARQVAVTYDESRSGLVDPRRAVMTGNPVRASVLSAERERGRTALGLPADATVLLVFGGSRGARHLNSAIVALCDRLMGLREVHLVLVAGSAEFAAVRAGIRANGCDGERIHLFEYLQDMGSAIAASDVVVARAGATSIAEITALGKPCVLVPYPFATDDHQTRNAAVMVDHGAAVLIADADLDTERLADEVVSLLQDPERRATMSAASLALGRPDASSRVAALIRKAGAHSPHPEG